MAETEPKAPKFKAYCEERKGAIFMSFEDFDPLISTGGGYFSFDLDPTPFRGLTLSSDLQASVAMELSSDEWLLEVYRFDQKDVQKGTPINKDVYSVYLGAPSSWSLNEIVTAADTNADTNLDDFLDGKVMFLKWASSDIADHHLPSLPFHVQALLKSS